MGGGNPIKEKLYYYLLNRERQEPKPVIFQGQQVVRYRRERQPLRVEFQIVPFWGQHFLNYFSGIKNLHRLPLLTYLSS